MSVKRISKGPAAPFKRESFKTKVEESLRRNADKSPQKADPCEKYDAAAAVLKRELYERQMYTNRQLRKNGAKILYFVSPDFEPGRILGNSLINLRSYQTAQEVFTEMGWDIREIDALDPELEIGGGRYAGEAYSMLDSLSYLSYPVVGCGIRYQYGTFGQKLMDGCQKEIPMQQKAGSYPFEVRRAQFSKIVKTGGHLVEEIDENGEKHSVIKDSIEIRAVPYDIPVTGFDNDMVNTLRLWSAEPVHSITTPEGQKDPRIYRDALAQTVINDIAKLPCSRIGPYKNMEMSFQQQYFLVSAAVQDAVVRYKKSHAYKKSRDFHALPDHIVFHACGGLLLLAVPELMRILISDEGLSYDDAFDLAVKSCRYAEPAGGAAVKETWSAALVSSLAPELYVILEYISTRIGAKADLQSPADTEKTDILPIIRNGNIQLSGFLGGNWMPTENAYWGISQRRLILQNNPLLTEWFLRYIHLYWPMNRSHVGQLLELADAREVQKDIELVKKGNRKRLAGFIKDNRGTEIEPDSIFYVQAQPVTESNRQLLTILYIMALYNRIKTCPEMYFQPKTFIFAGKACAGAGGSMGCKTIELINFAAEKINHDADIKDRLKVVFLENCRSALSDMLCTAADICIDPSVPGSNDSNGSFNVKCIMNGAVILGSKNYMNLMIEEKVGTDNIFLFDTSAGKVYKSREDKVVQHSHDAFRDPEPGYILQQLHRGDYYNDIHGKFRKICEYLMDGGLTGSKTDPFFLTDDFPAYSEAHKEIEKAFLSEERRTGMAVRNIACGWFFSSDNTAGRYAASPTVWGLKKLKHPSHFYSTAFPASKGKGVNLPQTFPDIEEGSWKIEIQ